MGSGSRDRRHLVPGAIAVALVAVLGVLGAGAVGAWGAWGGQAPSTATNGTAASNAALVALQQANPNERQQLCQTYLNDVASRLGVSESNLEQALIGAAGSTIDQAVKDGKITSDMAAFLKGRLSALQSPLCDSLPAAGKAGPFGGAARALNPGTLLDAAAGALHETRQDLLTEIGALKAGENLKTIAQKHNVDYATVEKAVVDAARSQLDAAVKAGTVTQAQENAFLSSLQQKLDSGAVAFGGWGPMKGVEGGFRGMMRGFGHMFGGMFGGAAPATPAPAASPGAIGG